MTETDDLAAPVVLNGAEAKQFEEWMASERCLEVQSALRAACQSGRRLLEGRSLALESGLVVRYLGTKADRRAG